MGISTLGYVGAGYSIHVQLVGHDWQPTGRPRLSLSPFERKAAGCSWFQRWAAAKQLCGFGYRPRGHRRFQILFYSSLPGSSNQRSILSSHETPQEVLTDFASEFISPLRVAWHPDGHRLSVSGHHRQFGWSFWTVPLTDGPPLRSPVDSRVEAQLKDAAVTFADFVWLPSAQGLIFEGESQGVRNLWKIKVDPRTLGWIDGPLNHGCRQGHRHRRSTDGRKLAFSIRTKEARLWTLPFDPSRSSPGTGQPLTVAGMDALQPRLSPDGRCWCFGSRANKEEVW